MPKKAVHSFPIYMPTLAFLWLQGEMPWEISLPGKQPSLGINVQLDGLSEPAHLLGGAGIPHLSNKMPSVQSQGERQNT